MVAALHRNRIQTEVMEKSKERLMEELMAKLRENLVKGREQGAAKEDVENVFKEGGPVQEVLVAEIKNGSEDAFKKEDVVLDDSVEAQK